MLLGRKFTVSAKHFSLSLTRIFYYDKQEKIVKETVMKTKIFFVLFILLTIIVKSVGFSEELEEEKAVNLSLSGYYRVRGISFNNVEYLDPSLNSVVKDSKTAYLQQRLRLEPKFRIAEGVSINMQADVLDDAIWGDNSCYVNGSYDPTVPGCGVPALAGNPSALGWNYLYQYENRMFVVKRVWAEASTPLGELHFGRMTSHWGLGLLDNDGNGFRNEWGDAHFGNTTDRIEFLARPAGKEKPYRIAVGYDKTVEGIIPQKPGEPIDDIDRWFIKPYYCGADCSAGSPDRFIGAFIGYRVQPKTETKILEADAYLMFKFLENYIVKFDMLYLVGASNAFGDLQAGDEPDTDPNDIIPDKVTVNAPNAVLKLIYDEQPFQLGLEAGYASGDRNGGYNSNKQLNAYTWNPDYNVGLLMFEELIARQSSAYAQGIAESTDVSLVPLVATKGGVRNATYAMITPKFYLIDNFVEAKMNVLWGMLNEKSMNPFGGNYYGTNTAGKNLGLELDWGIEMGMNLKTGVQVGYFWPGNAFKGPNGNHPNMFTMQIRLTVPF